MVTPHRSIIACTARAILLTGLVAFGTALPASSAMAQGLFDFLGGIFKRPAPPASASAYTDPNAPVGAQAPGGPDVAYCVRLCDGRFFPIQRSSGMNAAQACSAFCPAARTKIFSGSAIDHAAATDGSRYKDLSAAFVFRARTVADCTCNGKDPYGLITADANDDPTLQPGDIVATEQGFVAYNGGHRDAAFTPIASYGGLSAELRQRLAGAKIAPKNEQRESVRQPAPDSNAAASTKRAQLAR